MPKSPTPRYQHDCKRCVFLGHHLADDLYVCDAEPTIVSRHSSAGPDYQSGICFARSSESLRQAALRAIELGHLTKGMVEHYTGLTFDELKALTL